MKIIKYRIWNPEEKKMIESGATPMMLHSFFKSTARLNTQYEQEYQQFTGLLDKNGKEIYEGDIIRGAFPPRHYSDLTTYVHFYNGCFMLGKFVEPLERYSIEFEVVGNIYSNPELIKN